METGDGDMTREESAEAARLFGERSAALGRMPVGVELRAIYEEARARCRHPAVAPSRARGRGSAATSLSLRDAFACAALPAACNAASRAARDIAQDAYAIADAMLAERDKK